jgi:hypothetical protein
MSDALARPGRRAAIQRDPVPLAWAASAYAPRTLNTRSPEAAGIQLHAAYTARRGLMAVVAGAAEAQPTLLVVDDAHWADEPSLRLLTYLAGRIRDQPIGLLLAARSGEPGAGQLLAHLAGERRHGMRAATAHGDGGHDPDPRPVADG